MSYKIINCPAHILTELQKTDKEQTFSKVFRFLNNGRLGLYDINRFFDIVYFIDNSLDCVEVKHSEKTVSIELKAGA